MNKIGFFIFFSIYLSINFYIYVRGRQALPKDTLIQLIYSIIFIFSAAAFFISFSLEGKISPTITAICENVGGFWFISLLYFLVVVLLADILRLSNYFFGIFPEVVKANYAQAKLIYFGAVMALLVLLSIIGYAKFSNPKTVNLNIAVNKNGTNNLSIVAVSDVHLGDMIRKKRLIKYVELINKQNPDLILIAGDLFDRNLHTIENQNMQPELQKLKAKYGVYAVLGNHEYFGNVQKAAEIIKESGITLLKDTAVNIDNKLTIVGRDDHMNKNRKSLKNILANANTGLPVLVLDHQPVNLGEAVENNVDIQISGHTHNGQIFPINKIVAKIYQLAHGYKKIKNTHFYVSSGLGLWGAPIRLGTQSEIIKIQLNSISGQ
jgi:predicted MPP superfamily phosphohydrolase